MPSEITCHILSSCDLKKGQTHVAPHYLSQIARVCKTWNNLMHDIAVILLNKGEIRLVHIPFIAKEKRPNLQTFYISLYLEFINGKTSLEEVQRLSQNQLSLPPNKKKTFNFRKMTYIDLTDLRYFDKWLTLRVEPFFKNFETLVRSHCSFKDTLILPKFTELKSLNITPNYNTDLSFIKTLEKLEHLSIHFICKILFENTLDTLSMTNTVSSLALSTSEYPYLNFKEGFCLPNQIKDISLKGFNFRSDILDKSSEVERIDLKNTYLKMPISFESLEKLRYLSLHIRELITTLAIKNLNLDFLGLTAVSLQKLTMENCFIKKFKPICPLMESTPDVSSSKG
jgi:hypothetical protein